MIYLPMFKNRRAEMGVLKNMNACLSDKIIPLIEILADRYEIKYKVDPITNDFVYEQRGKARRRIKEETTDENIITLETINALLKGKRVFIDYFRFNIKKYGNKININDVTLAWKLSNDQVLYKKRIKDISRFPNMIPVVSVKDGFDMSTTELKNFLQGLQKENDIMALRITEEWLKKYEVVLKSVLRTTDYLLFDIGEQNPATKFMEMEGLIELEISAKVILLNSPRKAALKNGEYDIHGATELINNCAREKITEYDFEGFGDYCGLKDTLPSAGGNGTGAALALLYDYDINMFYSYRNPDTSLGIKGYKKLIPIIVTDKPILDKVEDCPVFKIIEEMQKLKKTGHWSTWHSINAMRYIHQVHKNI